MSWKVAESTCRNVKAELISLRSKELIPLVYQATDKKQRRKRLTITSAKDVGWTSAHLIEKPGRE